MAFITSKLIIIVTILVRRVDLVSHPLLKAEEEFCYIPQDNECGPSTWSGECQSGDRQSPIDINYKRHGIVWNKSNLKFNIPYFQTHHNFFAKNTGDSFRVQLVSDEDPMSDLTVAGGGLKEQYSFAQLHFHWGQSNDGGSEHTIMGRRYPMEMHVVHYKSSYGSFGNAMDEGDPEAVAVFAVLFELGAHNPAFESIVEAASSPESQDPEGELVNYRLDLNVKKLLPLQMDFVRYAGSLTTPPCTQTVTWTVFVHPISISEQQLNAIRQLRNREEERYYNFRPIQRLNGRKLTFYKALGGPIAPVISSVFEKVKLFFWALWKALGQLSHLITFHVNRPLLFLDDNASQALWKQNWFLSGLLKPMFIIFNK